MMRGGNTDSTVVIADAPIESPPVVSRAWSAIGLHDEFWAPIEPKLRPGGVVIVNDTTFHHEIAVDVAVYRIKATEIAADLGNPLGGSMVIVSAYCGLTGAVGIEALVAAMRDSIPSYRQQHIASNERALRAGFALLTPDAHRFWNEEVSA